MSDPNRPTANMFNSIYAGEVTENIDPEKLGRVKIAVPGIADDPDSDWAYPVGMPGAGTSQRGLFDVPGIGAEVYIFFLGGDVDKPRFFTGHWGIRPNEGSEIPTQARDALDENPEDADKIKVYETNTYTQTYDEREGKERWFIKRKRVLAEDPTFDDEDLSGHALMIEMDATNGTIAISAPGGISLQTLGLIEINGTIVQLAGRKVANGLVDMI